MTTRREYLVGLGLAKEGRGKFSRDALAALDKARAGGTKFSDDEPKPAPVKRDKPTAKAPKERDNYGDIVYTFPEVLYRAVEKDTGVERSMRSVCYTCGVSLVGHVCGSPTIVSRNASGPVSVTIEKR